MDSRIVLLAAIIACAPVPGRSPSAQSNGATPNGTLAPAVQAAAELPRLHSLLVSWQGNLVLEQYFNGTRASRPANVKSVSKSLISALVGIAIERDFIESVDQPITAFFPDAFTTAADAPKRTITVEDLLTMRAGLESTSSRNYGAWVRSRNWVRYALARPLSSEPGIDMDYSTGNTHLLSAIITKVTRKSTRQFAQDVLAGPLGFTLADWPRDPQGVYFGGNDMLLTPRQMVAFGELYLNRGVRNGRQVLPAAWVDASFVARARSHWSDQLYGYGWWMRDISGRRIYFAWGYGGQFIFVVPDLQLVVVTTSSTTADDERRGHRRTVQDVVEQFVIEPIALLRSTTGTG